MKLLIGHLVTPQYPMDPLPNSSQCSVFSTKARQLINFSGKPLPWELESKIIEGERTDSEEMADAVSRKKKKASMRIGLLRIKR